MILVESQILTMPLDSTVRYLLLPLWIFIESLLPFHNTSVSTSVGLSHGSHWEKEKVKRKVTDTKRIKREDKPLRNHLKYPLNFFHVSFLNRGKMVLSWTIYTSLIVIGCSLKIYCLILGHALNLRDIEKNVKTRHHYQDSWRILNTFMMHVIRIKKCVEKGKRSSSNWYIQILSNTTLYFL